MSGIVASGLADRKRGLPARTSDRFWVGSVTKSFVATLVMQLVAEGKLKSTDGVYGIRMAHNTEAVVSGFTMTKN